MASHLNQTEQKGKTLVYRTIDKHKTKERKTCIRTQNKVWSERKRTKFRTQIAVAVKRIRPKNNKMDVSRKENTQNKPIAMLAKTQRPWKVKFICIFIYFYSNQKMTTYLAGVTFTLHVSIIGFSIYVLCRSKINFFNIPSVHFHRQQTPLF